MEDDKLSDEEGRLAALQRYDILDTAGDEPFERVVDLVQQILDVPIAGVSLIDAEQQWLKAARGTELTAIPRDVAFCTETIGRHEALSITDVASDGRFAGNPFLDEPSEVHGYLGAPLRTPDGYNVGTLFALDRLPRAFDGREAGIIERLAEIVVEQFELRQIAKQDAMTGALTRRGFFGEVEREFLRATRYERPSALVVIDIDHFRSINDRFGHPAGDAVLTSIANTCMSAMRKSDIFGRIGGEEFGLLLPETDGEEAHDAADRIRRLVEETIVDVDGVSIRATVSLGIAPIPAASEGAATWFAEADIALYEAKNFGRNRVVAGKPRRPAPLPTDALHQVARPH